MQQKVFSHYSFDVVFMKLVADSNIQHQTLKPSIESM